MCRVVGPSGHIGAKAGDGEARVEYEPRLDRGARLVNPPELREGGAQHEVRVRKISVGLDRPSKPRDRLLPTAELALRYACVSHATVSHRIAWTKPQGLSNVCLCFFGATDKSLTKSDKGMGLGEVSIQRQRMFTFGDALRGALGLYLDIPQQHMAACMVRD